MFDKARKIGRSGEPWYTCNRMSFLRPFLLDPVFFRTALPCSGGYHLEMGGMPLHDAVGKNRKNGAATENQGANGNCALVLPGNWRCSQAQLLPTWWREKVVV